MKRLVLGMALCAMPIPAQDRLPIEVDGETVIATAARQPVLHVLWLGDLPVVLFDSPFIPQMGGGPVDHFEETYVSVGGTLVRVYVECGKRTSEDCLAIFKKRSEQLKAWLKVDIEATKKYLKIS